MFGNFIYFIIVLLLYATYQHPEETNFSSTETLFFFIGLIFIFEIFCRMQFKNLAKRIPKDSFPILDHIFNKLLLRLSILAIALCAVDIYGFNITTFLLNLPLFSAIPTLQALVVLGIFIFYLSILWANAYTVYSKLYSSDLSKKAYVFSNISFSIPVLLPWVLLSGISDLIFALPFDTPKRILSTKAGASSYFLLFLFIVTIVGPAMIQKLWQCKPIEKGRLRTLIENLCKRADLKYSNILYWPIFGGKMITAGVMGLVKRFRYILVTDALLNFLSPEEIEAVIAHEIGHVKKKHLLFYLFFFAGFMLISLATFDFIKYSVIYAEPIYKFIVYTGFNHYTVSSVAISIVFIIILLVYFRFIFGYFMRNFERQADTYVYTLFDSAQPLIKTFEKIALTSGQPPDKPNWHHFSIYERIEYLKKCESDRTWIKAQDNKIRKSIAVFIVGMVVMGSVGYQLNFGKTGEIIAKHFSEKANLNEKRKYLDLSEKYVLKMLKEDPGKTALYEALGEIYYLKNDLENSAEAFEKAIELNSKNPEVYNNLAWLYATDERLKNPKRALQMALKAAGLRKAPHILDTLAESYFVNGDYGSALKTGMLALKLTNRDKEYFEKQLNKFQKAAKKKMQQKN